MSPTAVTSQVQTDPLSQFSSISTNSEFVTEFYKMMLRLIDRGAKKVVRSELNLLKYELQGETVPASST